MFKAIVTILALSAVSFGAYAESRSARLSAAHAKLQEGDPAAALEALRELQVEDPSDERVLYALACAQYRLAEAQAATGDPNTAFKDAQAAFETLSRAKDPGIARQASFDRANCLAQAAKLSMADPKNAKAAVGALQAAAAAFEAHLAVYPDDKGARQNLDHVRFLMKNLQREKKDEEQKQDEKKDDKQPKAVLSVRNAVTELPGATAVVGDDATVQLVKPGATP
jgi:tetratricopeptide (TPR) repeat protein